MPKYIRTKDGIYEVVEDSNKEWGKQIVVKFPKNLNMKLADVKDQIIKQSDNLAELCDEAVAIYPDGSHDNCSVMHIVDNNGFCEAVYGCLSVSADDLKKNYECWEVYGAIWTDKGLIYVAKMNEKGELVLI